jgi:hypothetical protein
VSVLLELMGSLVRVALPQRMLAPHDAAARGAMAALSGFTAAQNLIPSRLRPCRIDPLAVAARCGEKPAIEIAGAIIPQLQLGKNGPRFAYDGAAVASSRPLFVPHFC